MGNKAINERIETLSPSYAGVSDYLRSETFLRLASELTCIPNLLPDITMYGGGTRENGTGKNSIPTSISTTIEPTKLHRRLNLLVYLNKEWDENGRVDGTSFEPKSRTKTK